MEEMLGNVPGARQVFERWMKWEPDSQGWASYINFETRHEEIDRAREIYERYIRCHPEGKTHEPRLLIIMEKKSRLPKYEICYKIRQFYFFCSSIFRFMKQCRPMFATPSSRRAMGTLPALGKSTRGPWRSWGRTAGVYPRFLTSKFFNSYISEQILNLNFSVLPYYHSVSSCY